MVRVDPYPDHHSLDELWRHAWGDALGADYATRVLSRSLGHIGAYVGNRLIGFINVAWDGGVHAFILDTCVHPEYRRAGIATRLVKEATSLARSRGAQWLHVDFEPHLETLYRSCGFRASLAGLIDLSAPSGV